MRGRLVGAAIATLAASTLAVVGPAPSSTAARAQADCPVELSCRFVQAAASRFGDADRRIGGLGVRYIVVHDTELGHDETARLFTQPEGARSAHYLLRSKDGAVTQFVRNDDVAFHTGNAWYDLHSIGVQHEGFLLQGKRWYTEEMYRASAALVRHLAARYGIPLDRAHILGQDEISPAGANQVASMRHDPGPYWNWEHYFELLGAPLVQKDVTNEPRPAPSVMQIAPLFGWNTRPLQTCTAGKCRNLKAQGSNVVFLRTEPRADAPLVSDPVLRPDGTPGTTAIGDLSARAVAGQRFVVAERRNGWVGIWFGGRLAWFFDKTRTVGLPADGMLVTALPGRLGIPLYGAAYPEGTAYSSGAQPAALEPLPYTLPAGQFYVGLIPHLSDDLARYPDGSRGHVEGERRFVEISFNHRRAFVDLADVLILNG